MKIKVLLTLEDGDAEKYSDFLERFTKLLEEAPIKPEKPTEISLEEVTKDTAMTKFELTDKWQAKFELYKEEKGLSFGPTIEEFVDIDSYTWFRGRKHGGYLDGVDVNVMTRLLARLTERFWPENYEIPIDALIFHNPTLKSNLKAEIGSEVLRSPEIPWKEGTKMTPNNYPMYYYRAILSYIFHPTDKLESLSELRKVGKISEKSFENEPKMLAARKEFERNSLTTYSKDMDIKTVFAGIPEHAFSHMVSHANVYASDGLTKRHVERVMRLGEFCEKVSSSEFSFQDRLEDQEERFLISLKLESILRRIWTSEIGTIKLEDLKLDKRTNTRMKSYEIFDFKDVNDVHEMFTGVSTEGSRTRIDVLLKLITNILNR